MKKSLRKGLEVYKSQRKGGTPRGLALRRALSQKNPAKAIRLKNFTGTVRINPNKTVSVKGKAKRK